MIDATDVNETFLRQLAQVGSVELFQFMIVAPSFEKQCALLELDTFLKWPDISHQESHSIKLVVVAGSRPRGGHVRRGRGCAERVPSRQNNYSFDALQAYCFGINIKL